MNTTVTIDEGLLAHAQAVSGLHEMGPLVNAALQALIYRDCAQRLAQLRKSLPDLGNIAHRRDFDL